MKNNLLYQILAFSSYLQDLAVDLLLLSNCGGWFRIHYFSGPLSFCLAGGDAVALYSLGEKREVRIETYFTFSAIAKDLISICAEIIAGGHRERE